MNQLFVELDGYQWIKCPLCRKARLFQTTKGISDHVRKYHQQFWMVGWFDVPKLHYITDEDWLNEKVP